MKFAWPEIQKRLVSECGNNVAGPLEEESSGGEVWHEAEVTVAMPTTRNQIACRNLDVESDIPLPRMNFIHGELPEGSKPYRHAARLGKFREGCAVC